ncbi:MAG: TatD family hydrolase [Polyangiales bacterium]
MIDTHVHLDSDAFGEGAAAVWDAARARGVTGALAVGVEPASWERTIATAHALPGVSLALGIHPQVVPHLDDATIARALRDLPDLLEKHGAHAVGEIGLDGPAGDPERQERVMLAQLDIARQMHLPVSLHVFKLHGRALELLRAFGSMQGVAHSYSGSSELVRDYLGLGWSISFAGSITRSNARKPIAACRAVPLERLVVETDAPFQPTGADARDRKRGDPGDLGDVIAAIARARDLDPEAVAAATTANARRIFRL